MKKQTLFSGLIISILLATLCRAAGTGKIIGWGSQLVGVDLSSDFVTVAVGESHNLGLKQDGSIVAWGYNNHGQCNVPSLNTGFIAIAAGAWHSLGLKQDGSIVAWGDNGFGQCDVPSPNTGFVAIAAGRWHSLGLKQDGSIAAWGYNWYGQCNVPSPNTGFVAIAASEYHSLGLKQNGSIIAWKNWFTVPSPNTGFVAVATGPYHSLGLKQDGSIVAWGWNDYGKCNVPSPNTGFVAVAAGWWHSLGLKQDGSIVAWGLNDYGQCNVPSPNTGFIFIAARENRSLAIMSVNKEPSVCIAGGDQIVEADSNCEAKVVLDGSCSSDDDSTPGTNDDINDFDWYQIIDPCDPNGALLLGSGEIIECNLPLGVHSIMLVVTDKAGASDSNEIVITVEDNTPPVFSLSVEPNVLWPVNHKMIEIQPSWSVSDNCDEQPDVSLVDITIEDTGNTGDDIFVDPNDGSIWLRAERSGKGSGRVYTITYQAIDDSNNIATASAMVTVPHDQR